MPEPRTLHVRNRPQHRGIDGAEHSARIARVMPVFSLTIRRGSTDRNPRRSGRERPPPDESRTAHENKEGGRSRPGC